MASIDILLNNRFRLESKISAGAFGTVYRGLDIHTGDKVAIKIEPAAGPHPQLSYEFKVYEALQSSESPEARIGIPRVHWYGREGHYYVLVIDLLGCSLEDLFTLCHRKFSLKTTLMLADQMISRIQYMHGKGFIHRDIKPDNFVIGREEFCNCVYSIDFGLAKRYRDPETLQHIPYTNNRSLIGTARYASVHSHIGLEQSRRDDLEAIGYVLIYFLKGQLPWQGLKGHNKAEKFAGINESKMTTSLETLCLGLPQEFLYYFQHIRSLSFEEKPDYLYLRRLFRELFQRLGYLYDLQFDWSIPLRQSKYAPNIFSQSSLTLSEQIITNTSFLIHNNEGIHNINQNQFDANVDFNSMSFLIDTDVLEFYREAANQKESHLYQSFAKRHQAIQEGHFNNTTTLSTTNQPDVYSTFGSISNTTTNTNTNNHHLHHQQQQLQQHQKPSNVAITATGGILSEDLISQLSVVSTSSLAPQQDPDITLETIQFNKNYDTTPQQYLTDVEGNQRNSDGTYINDPIFPSSDVESWTRQLAFLLDVKARDDQQKDLFDMYPLNNVPNPNYPHTQRNNNQMYNNNHNYDGSNYPTSPLSQGVSLQNHHGMTNQYNNHPNNIMTNHHPNMNNNNNNTFTQHHPHDPHYQQTQYPHHHHHQQQQQHQHHHHNLPTNVTMTSNSTHVIDLHQSDPQSGPVLSQNALHAVTQQQANYDKIRPPSNLEMMGTIQFAQKQYHTFTLFLQVLCKQVIYIENALSIISSKAKTFTMEVQKQAKIEAPIIPPQTVVFDTNNIMSTPQPPMSNAVTTTMNSISISPSTSPSTSSSNQIHIHQPPIQITNKLVHGLPDTPQQTIVQTAEELIVLFDMQIIVLEQQLQYSRQQQQVVMNVLTLLHQYLKALLLEHQHQRVMYIQSQSFYQGHNNDEKGPKSLIATPNTSPNQLSLQLHRQALQQRLKKFNFFDYSSLTDQRVQIQRLFFQLKAIQNVKESAFFQFMNVTRSKRLLPFSGHPFAPSPTQFPLLTPPEQKEEDEDDEITNIIKMNQQRQQQLLSLNNGTATINSRQNNDSSSEEDSLEEQHKAILMVDPNVLMLGGSLTPINALHTARLTPYNGPEDVLDISLGPARDFIELQQRLLCLQDNEVLVLKDQEQLIQLSVAAGEAISVLQQHCQHFNDIDKQFGEDIQAIGETKFTSKLTIKDHFYDHNNPPPVFNPQNEQNDDKSNTNTNTNINNKSVTTTATTKSGLTMTRGKIIRRGGNTTTPKDTKDVQSTTTTTSLQPSQQPSTPMSSPQTIDPTTSTTTTTTSPQVQGKDTKKESDNTYIEPDEDSLHPGVRASLVNLSALHFKPEDIKAIEQLPRLHDYGFHTAVNTLLQLEFENPNLIHMYILYRKYLQKRSKHPRHFPILIEAQSMIDFSLPNDLNNVSSVLKLLLFYIKTLPVGQSSKNGTRESIYQSITDELESLLTLEPNQLLHHLSNTNIYPRVFDGLLLKNPSFIKELVKLGYDDYSTQKIINILQNAKIPLPDDYNNITTTQLTSEMIEDNIGDDVMDDIQAKVLENDGINIGIQFDINGDIIPSNNNTNTNQQQQQPSRQQIKTKLTQTQQKLALTRQYFLSLFPQSESLYTPASSTTTTGSTIDGWDQRYGLKRFQRNTNTGELIIMNADEIAHAKKKNNTIDITTSTTASNSSVFTANNTSNPEEQK